MASWVLSAEVVERIRVEGNTRLDTQAVLSHLSLKKGHRLTESSMNQALKELYALGFFQDVQLRRQGGTLILKVVENPIINRIAFEGNEKLSDDDLKVESGLRIREVYNQEKVREAARKILQLYRFKGKFSAKVTPKRINQPENRVDVVFEINEGQTVEIGKILFVGNRRVSSSQLRSVISTKESRWYRFLSSDDTYDPARLEYDKELLRQYYRSQGFADFEVVSAGAEPSPRENAFFVTFTVQEGRRYQFGSVRLVSDILPKEKLASLEPLITIKSGEWFNDKEVERTVLDLLKEMGKHKIYFADVVPEIERDLSNPDRPLIRVVLRVVKTDPIYINRILISGNTGTHDSVIRRNLLFAEGDALNNSELERSKRNIENLDFFKQVDFDLKPAEQEDRRDLNIKVAEKPTGEFMIGGGFSSAERLIFDFRAKERNFLGRGQEVDLHLMLSKRSKSIVCGFTEPYFLNRHLEAGVDVFATRYKQDTRGNFGGGYTSKDLGLGLRLGYKLFSDHLFQIWNYSLKREDIGGIRSESPFLSDSKGKRDSYVRPAEGYRLELSNEWSGLGGNVKYLGNALTAKWYHPLNSDRDIILAVRSKYKFLVETGKGLRMADHYFSGFSDFQGFDQSGVGPRDRKTGDALGGKQFLLGTCEVLFPLGLPKEFDLRGRSKSISALRSVVGEGDELFLVAQKDSSIEDPNPEDLYTIGTLGIVRQILTLPDGSVKALISGKKRLKVQRYFEHKEYFEAECESFHSVEDDPATLEPLKRTLISEFEQYIHLYREDPSDILSQIHQAQSSEHLIDMIAVHVVLKVELKQNLLEKERLSKRLELLVGYIGTEIAVLQTQKRIRSRIRNQVEKNHRDYLLNEQLKAIQRELGDGEDPRDELSELESRIANTKLSKEAEEKAKSELKKLRNMNQMSAEATVVRNYLDWLLALPWDKRTRVRKDLKKAEAVLNQDHYGLEKVKERILEYLAVQVRVDKVRGSILCLVGPPGVGKTSLGRSIAKATGRQFVRVALGGIRDESEIRGHRRTYIASMPGKMIQGMKKAKTTNPLFLLDEVDKIGADWRGDPASALLEVLDPEQNKEFMDHYLEVGYDLSNVLFITTANSLRMPPPLLDRMEIIHLSGYTEDEKVEIAKRHLLPKQFSLHGLKQGEISISDEALRSLVRHYCREAGVRQLEREIAKLARKAVRQIVARKTTSVKLTKVNLEKYAGIPRFRTGEAETKNLLGITTGLAWTEAGGDLLLIEAVMLPGKGKITTTGKLGEVMQESVQAASSFVRSRSIAFGIKPTLFEKRDIHVHVPEGATPKDGPSAGVAMCTSIVSVLTGIPVRNDVAMTGEISLRGRVLPFGGLKEKLLAAHRGNIKKVLIPHENIKDLEEVPEVIKKQLEIIPVTTVEEVLQQALVRHLIPIEWLDEDEKEKMGPGQKNPPPATTPSTPNPVTH
eukprot:g8341.t1